MTKIKKVTIENFRAYEGTHEFSFLNGDKLANLVVVYAPNGYGKTSFFDAVEWAFSNKIRRFENGVLKQELESKEFASDDQIILTNRAGYYKGGKGEITIITDEDKIIKRIVIPRRIPNTDFKNDYRDVELLGDYIQEEISMFTEYNMLTQDQIDSFLKFKTPEEKFNALKEFWPQGSEASEVFSRLSIYSRILNTKLVDVNRKIIGIEGEIDKNINSDINFFKINKWISELNEEKLIDIKFPVITKDIDEEVYLGIIQSNETYKLVVNSQALNAENTSMKFSILLNSYSSYLQNISEIKSAEESFSIQSNIESSLEKVRFLNENNNSKLPIIRRLTTEKTGIERLIFLWSDFIQDKQQLQFLQSETFRFHQEIEQKSEKRDILEAQLQDIIEERDHLNLELEQVQAIASKIEVNLRQIDKLRTDITEGIEHQQYSESCIANIKISIANTYFERATIVELLEKEDFSYYQTEDIAINYYLGQLSIKTKNIQEISDQQADLNIEMDKKGSFSENLNRLVKWAEHQVSEQQIASCPMCNTSFTNVADLLDAISNEKGDILMVSELQRNIDECCLIRKYFQEELNLVELNLMDLFNERLLHLNQEIEYIENTIEKFEANIRKDQDAIDHANFVILEILDQIVPDSYFSYSHKLDLDNIRSNNKEIISSLSSRLKNKDEELTTINTTLKVLNNSLMVLRNAVSNNGNKINLIQAKDSFIECTELLKENLIINFEGLDLNYLQKELQRCSIAIEDDRNIIKEQEKAIESVQTELKESGNLLSIVQVQEKLNEIERNLIGLKYEKESFETSYRALISNEDFNLESIQSQYEYFNSRQHNLLILKQKLEEFGIDLAVIESDVLRNKLQKELYTLKIELRRTEVSAARIEMSKVKVGSFITDGVDQYFNKDVINQIYKKIEPHPKLTEIDIRVESTGKLPKLTIRAKSDSEELAPGLFLSTGQVNVLSLSIFIARAYEMGSDKFNCIFMDDPVQNMSDINVLSFVDLLRILISDQDKQVMISTHDEKFFRLLKNKLSPDFFRSKFIELGSYGKLKEDVLV